MCQYSLVFGGLKQKLYDQFRKDVCEAYGAKHIFTFQNLAKVGLLHVHNGSKSPFSQISKALKLVNDYDSDNVADVSAVYRGFAPISVRLIQAASRILPQTSDTKSRGLSWKGYEDVLALTPGKLIEKSIIPETRSFKTSSTTNSLESPEKIPITLVVFIGGCTFAEISALRNLSRNEKGSFSSHSETKVRDSYDIHSERQLLFEFLDGLEIIYKLSAFASRMQSLSIIDQGIRTWTEVLPLINNTVYKRISCLNLHSNLLTKIDHGAIQMLSGLTILDLSSNNVDETHQIETIDGLQYAPQIQYLNLSNNQVNHDNPDSYLSWTRRTRKDGISQYILQYYQKIGRFGPTAWKPA
jgi:hypothetical protein